MTRSTIDATLATADVDPTGTATTVYFDLKLADADAHRQYTGRGNARILENLRLLTDMGRDVWVRVPLVPGINDVRTAAEIEQWMEREEVEFPIMLKPAAGLYPTHLDLDRAGEMEDFISKNRSVLAAIAEVGMD